MQGDPRARESVAGATTAAATAPSAGEAARRSGGARANRGEHRELDRRLLAGALGAGDLLLLIDDDLFEALVAFITDVFVNRHGFTQVYYRTFRNSSTLSSA